MSRGHGKVQRAILAVFAADPGNAFLLSELCERVYPGLNRIEKKHRNAVARAAKAIPTIDHMKCETLGGELVFYDPINVLSYAMARLKSDQFNHYRSNDTRWFEPRGPKGYREAMGFEKGYRYQWTQKSEPDLRAMLAPGGRDHKHIVEGGVWWKHTERRKALARGDEETAARLRAELDAELDAIGLELRNALPTPRDETAPEAADPPAPEPEPE
jgi:hypothetical protein